jgi:MFS family permease
LAEKIIAPSDKNEPKIFYGYVIVFVGFVLQVFGWGIFNSFGVFFKPLETEFIWSRAVVASAMSFSFLVAGFAGILMGELSDRFGPRLVMTGGGVLLGLGYLLMSTVSSLWEYYLYCTVIIGIGISGTDVVVLSTTARWFVKKRSMLTGVIKIGTGFGMMIMPLFINWLITQYGWRSTFQILGMMILIMYVTCSQCLVRDPVKKGLSPDGAKNKNPIEPTSGEKGLSIKDALRTTQLWTICVVYSLLMYAIATVMFHIVPIAIDLGISAANAANVLATLGSVSIAGRFVMGTAGDRIGTKSSLVICFLLLSSGLVWLQFSTTLWMLLLFAVIHGFAHGGFFTLISPLLADFFGTRSHGAIFGVLTSVSAIGSAVGPVMAGYMFDKTGSYQLVFLVLTGMSFAGLVGTFLLKPAMQEP